MEKSLSVLFEGNQKKIHNQISTVRRIKKIYTQIIIKKTLDNMES